jgi:hypothetical protein
MPVEAVAQALLKLLAARRPPLHLRIGAARMLPHLRSLLPERLFHRAIARSFLASS